MPATKRINRLCKNQKVRESYISPYWLDPPPDRIFMNFVVRGEIADITTHDKFLGNRFTGNGVLTTHFYPRDLLSSRGCLSVCPSVTRQYYV